MASRGRWRAQEPRTWTAVELVTWIVLLVPTALVLGAMGISLAPPPPCPATGICEGFPIALLVVPVGLAVLGPLVILLAGFGRPRLRKPGAPVPRVVVVLVWTWMAGPALAGLHVLVGGRVPAAQTGAVVVVLVSLVVPFVVTATTRDLPAAPPAPSGETVDWWGG
jgi:hypothetical protein